MKHKSILIFVLGLFFCSLIVNYALTNGNIYERLYINGEYNYANSRMGGLEGIEGMEMYYTGTGGMGVMPGGVSGMRGMPGGVSGMPGIFPLPNMGGLPGWVSSMPPPPNMVNMGGGGNPHPPPPLTPAPTTSMMPTSGKNSRATTGPIQIIKLDKTQIPPVSIGNSSTGTLYKITVTGTAPKNAVLNILDQNSKSYKDKASGKWFKYDENSGETLINNTPVSADGHFSLVWNTIDGADYPPGLYKFAVVIMNGSQYNTNSKTLLSGRFIVEIPNNSGTNKQINVNTGSNARSNAGSNNQMNSNNQPSSNSLQNSKVIQSTTSLTY